MIRYYSLSLTANGPEQHEFKTEDERSTYHEQQDATYDDWFCLDVDAEGNVNFYLAITGGEA
jgi:hypothetical protein